MYNFGHNVFICAMLTDKRRSFFEARYSYSHNMVWFTGEVADAVKEVKQQSKLLLVFVKGSDEASTFVESQFNDETEAAFTDITCLSMNGSSHSAAQFFEVYPANNAPCLYLIGPNGQVIDIKTGRIETKELVEWVMLKSSLAKPACEVNQPNDLKNSGTALCSGPSTSNTNTQRPLNERLEYAQQLVEIRRRQKEGQAQRKCNDDEIKRRQLGKSLNDFKEQQRRREISEAIAERKKDELEARELREQLRIQIDDDRRALKERNSFNQLQSTNAPQQVNQPVSSPLMCYGTPASDSDTTKLQLRLLDGAGEHLICKFPTKSTIHTDVRGWLQQLVDSQFELDNVSRNLSDATKERILRLIKTGYRLRLLRPPRILQPEEESQTLLQLGLTPAAALFIVPIRQMEDAVSNCNTSAGITSQLFNLLNGGLSMVYNLFDWAINGIVSFGRNLVGSEGTNTNQRVDNYSNRIPDNSPRRGNDPRNKTSAIRRQGNVARLSHMPDNSDDEQARWNGNSTEQL